MGPTELPRVTSPPNAQVEVRVAEPGSAMLEEENFGVVRYTFAGENVAVE